MGRGRNAQLGYLRRAQAVAVGLRVGRSVPRRGVAASVVHWIDPRRVLPLHELRRPHHFAELVARMRRYGWQGRPVLVEVLADGKLRLRPSGHFINWTATHRLAAARAAGLRRVPAIFVNGGRPIGRLPMVTRTTTDPHRYHVLKQRRDPASVMMYAELRINAVSDEAGVL